MLAHQHLLELPFELITHILRYSVDFYNSIVNMKKTTSTAGVYQKYRVINNLSEVCLIFRKIVKQKVRGYALRCLNNPFVLNDELLLKQDFSYIKYFKMNKFSNISDEGLRCLPKLKGLILDTNDAITDIAHLTNLLALHLRKNTIITDSTVSNLTNLRELDIAYNNNISDISIRNLINLECLDLRHNPNVTNIKHLTKLIKLDLRSGNNGNIDSVNELTTLKTLYLGNNRKIGSVDLPNLTELDLTFNKVIYDITHLSTLKILNLRNNPNIRKISHLTNLTELDLAFNKIVTDEELKSLTNLTELNLINNNLITDEGISQLKKLKIIKLNNHITDLSDLTELRHIHLSRYSKISPIMLSKLPMLQYLIIYEESLFDEENIALLLVLNNKITVRRLYQI